MRKLELRHPDDSYCLHWTRNNYDVGESDCLQLKGQIDYIRAVRALIQW